MSMSDGVSRVHRINIFLVGMDCREKEALFSLQDEKFFYDQKTAVLMTAARFCCLEK